MVLIIRCSQIMRPIFGHYHEVVLQSRKANTALYLSLNDSLREHLNDSLPEGFSMYVSGKEKDQVIILTIGICRCHRAQMVENLGNARCIIAACTQLAQQKLEDQYDPTSKPALCQIDSKVVATPRNRRRLLKISCIITLPYCRVAPLPIAT